RRRGIRREREHHARTAETVPAPALPAGDHRRDDRAWRAAVEGVLAALPRLICFQQPRRGDERGEGAAIVNLEQANGPVEGAGGDAAGGLMNGKGVKPVGAAVVRAEELAGAAGRVAAELPVGAAAEQRVARNDQAQHVAAEAAD